MSQSITLVTGESVQVGDLTITVESCGMKRQGGGQPQPSVTLQIEGTETEEAEEAPEEPADPLKQFTNLGVSQSIAKKMLAKWDTVNDLTQFLVDGGDLSAAIKGIGNTTEAEIRSQLITE